MSDKSTPEQVAQFEKQSWSGAADVYPDSIAPLTRQSLATILAPVELRAGMNVLDVGCGPGDIANELALMGVEITGIDFAGPMVDVARERFPSLRFEQADVEQLPFEPGEFDVVTGNMVVHHFARPDAAFREIARVLKPGGVFTFIVPIPDTQTSFTAFLKALTTHLTPEANPSGPLYNIADPAVYEPILREAGFAECEFSRPEVRYAVPNLDALLRGGWAMAKLDEQPQDVQDNIRRDTIKNAEPYKTSDGYVFPDVMFMGVASTTQGVDTAST